MNVTVQTIRTLFTRNERFSAFSLGAIMLAVVVLIGVLSLAMLNDKASKGYLLTELEEARQELVTDGEITDMLTLRARSMTVIEEESYGMVKPERGDIYYVTPVVVAKN